MKTEHESYQCLKKDCNYIVHVNCATKDNDLYYITDQENQVQEQDENLMDSSIVCVIEKNEHGEATIIKHFYHEHNLLLEDKIKEDNDRHCDGCMLSISTPFYHCLECNFFLHKNCAELPKIKHHWFHRFVATLESKDFMNCDLCNRDCSGLFYKSSSPGRSFYFCLRCAIVPYIINCQGHKHFLVFDYKFKGQCNACGIGSYGAFRCTTCTFTLDFACVTLPHAIQHKCDMHLLQLTYGDENDDVEEHYCDICEEKRDSSHWYYYCSTCDNSAHTECVVGKYPFIKDGISWRYLHYGSGHNLIFVQKVDGYSECIICGKLGQDQTLKYSKCNNFRHVECRWG
ncbi:hypothetical protein CRYUN_Cryun41cG0042200 [Craigia yunnanensis]